MRNITYEEFEKVNLCSGTITKVEEFPRAKKPAFKVWADRHLTNISSGHYTLYAAIACWKANCWLCKFRREKYCRFFIAISAGWLC